MTQVFIMFNHRGRAERMTEDVKLVELWDYLFPSSVIKSYICEGPSHALSIAAMERN